MITARSATLTMPAVALRGLVVFPGSNISFDVGRSKSVLALKAAMTENQSIFLVTQKDIRDSDPDYDQLYKTGTIAKVNHIVRVPNTETFRVSVEGIQRAKLTGVALNDRYLVCDVKPKSDSVIKAEDHDYSVALIRQAKDLLEDYTEYAPQLPPDVILNVLESHNPGEIADLIAANIMLEYQDRQQILNEFNPVSRLEKVCYRLAKESDLLKLEAEINDKVQDQIDKGQREYYLHEQMRIIAEELGEGDSPEAECDRFKEKIESLGLQEEYTEKLLKECSRLEKMQASSPEANVLRVYLETCLDLPWNEFTRDNLDLKNARRILDRDHTGLDKVKDRMIEFLAVKSLTDKPSVQILCLVGPPGVGKTSIASSVAQAMGRKFARISLGGVNDEAEIRGHRKTYIGAMPGRIIAAIQQAKSANPLILLDEVDKLGSNYKGDPSSALLEALDPEQNKTFTDHYIEIPFDLSKVLFITTANDRSTIPAPLLDRMEIIELSSYTREEKFRIAKNHLVSKQKALHGLNGNNFRINDKALYALIDGYTREAGVRKLEQKIASLCRKAAVKIVDGSKKSVFVKETDLEDMLGAPDYLPENPETEPMHGTANGLAWTAVGGEMLLVEVAVLEGTGKVELTGSLGDVMKESAMAAISFVRAHAAEYGINPKFYKENDIHIHVPEGAVPKDGPSAGVTIATALVSALSGLAVDPTVAMTGEISLRGRVMPIGGLREKTMAAYKAGIKTVVIPYKNLPDLKEIDGVVKAAIDFVPVNALNEVFDAALIKSVPQSAAAAASLSIKNTSPYTTIRAERK
ncbi:MAG: endopeptidase La [Clostridia bacterium]|nr:endopeptidase La [Clostridia bacterium]